MDYIGLADQSGTFIAGGAAGIKMSLSQLGHCSELYCRLSTQSFEGYLTCIWLLSMNLLSKSVLLTLRMCFGDVLYFPLINCANIRQHA